MQKLAVTRDGKRSSDVMLLQAGEVLKLEEKRGKILVHTASGQFVLATHLEGLEEWLYEDGFRLIDSGNLVNMHQIRHYEVGRNRVYLGEPGDPATKTASVARIHREHVMHAMDIIRENKSKGANDDYATERLLRRTASEREEFLRSYLTLHAMEERRRAEERIHQLAYHDSLTGLPNRLLLHSRMEEAFREAELKGHMSAVYFIDLDRFKVINDTLGHHVGDELLVYIAGKFSSLAEQGAIVARFGGDEFVICLPDVGNVKEALVFAENIPRIIREPHWVEGHELSTTASIGISLYPVDGQDPHTLLKNADTAMYQAKERGGHSCQLYRKDMNDRSLDLLNMEIDLRKAVHREELTLYYQPLIDLDDMSVIGCEALLRWQHPQRGWISPAEFIPLAEETGLIISLGSWILKQACQQNKAWLDQGLPPMCISVNISASQFHKPGFVRLVQDTLAQTGLPPHLLCLEITENVAMKHVEHMVSTMSRLRELGVQIAIDDFGTGYSSLNYLKQFRVQTLKIDQSFIRDVVADSDSEAIVTALIAMSQKLKIKTLAEGVETMEQLEFLKRNGCQQIQGYLFSRPLPPEELLQWVRAQRLRLTDEQAAP